MFTSCVIVSDNIAGNPVACASITTFGIPSYNEGNTNTSIAESI